MFGNKMKSSILADGNLAYKAITLQDTRRNDKVKVNSEGASERKVVLTYETSVCCSCVTKAGMSFLGSRFLCFQASTVSFGICCIRTGENL